MYSALLVDDEKNILESIRNAVPWENLGVSLVLSASNAIEALGLLESHHVDLLISDIRMPGMDGLELLRHVRSTYPHIRCVLLSAYGEFEYARTALELGIENYLLKPLSVDELVATVQKSLDNLVQRKLIDQKLFHDNILLRWITGTISGDELVERTPMLNVNLYSRHYCIVIIRQMHPHNLELYAEHFEQELNRIYTVYGLTESDDTRDLILAAHEIDGRELLDILRHLAKMMNLPKDILVSVGPVIVGSAELNRSYSDAKSTLQYARLFSSLQVISFDETYTACLNSASETSIRNILAADTVEAAVAAGKAVLDQLFLHAGTPTELHVLAGEVGAIIFSKALDDMPPGTSTQLNALLAERCGPLPELPEKSSYYVWLENLITETWLLYHSETGGISPIVSHALNYIKVNYSGSISIKEFCSHFDINTSYLGYLFKTETGIFFNDYVCQVRINNAMLLLENTHKKIADVAEQVGFSNVSYFIKCFRSYTGLSPAKYRQTRRAQCNTSQKEDSQ